MAVSDLTSWLSRLRAFEDSAHSILCTLESSKSRKITLDVSYAQLDQLSVKKEDLFRQALRCVENELYRAAHVMCWAGLVDCLHNLVLSDNFQKLNLFRPNWHIASLDGLTENYTEHALIDALRVMEVLSKTESKAFFGMLSKRNECAHPGDYFPGLNETLGYISEIISRVRKLQLRFPNFNLSLP